MYILFHLYVLKLYALKGTEKLQVLVKVVMKGEI
jgi:hypothetical protein